MSAAPDPLDDVRLAAESPDATGVRELFELADAYGLSLYPPESYHALDPAEFARPEVTLLVARRRGRAVGIGALVLPAAGPAGASAAAAAAPAGAGFAELKRMFVHPDARGLGLARRLLGELEARAARAGVTVLRLETGPPQLAAIALYESSGYRPIPLFGPYVGDPQSLCFEKLLGAGDPGHMVGRISTQP